MSSTATVGAGNSARIGMTMLGFLSFNLAIGTIYGTFGVLFTPAMARVHAGPGAISWAPTVITLAVALFSPIAGILSGKVSLRYLQIAGSLLGAAGFAVLSVASDITTYLVAYALLVGPFFCLGGVVVPATLITRWFGNARGRAQGIVNFPIGTAVFPAIATFILSRYGATGVYLGLAGILVVNAFVQAFMIDRPAQPAELDTAADAEAPEATTSGAIVANPGFWALTLANAALVGATVMLSFHLIPLAIAGGIDAKSAAGLMVLMSVGGFFGPFIFGWVADKLGGRNTQILLCIDSAILWAVLLLLPHPSYPVLAGIVMLYGFHSSGSIPAFAVALAQTFGERGFARAYGLGNMIGLPVTALTPPIAGMIFESTHSYSWALILHLGFFVAAALLGLLLGGKTIIRGTGARPAMH